MSANPRLDPAAITATLAPRPSKAAFYTGWVLSGLLAVLLFSGGVTAALGLPQAAQGMVKFGFSPGILRPVGVIEIVCTILYLVPGSAVFGGLLLTAYLGGAVATHARIGDPMWVVPVGFGIVVWAALLLRQPRLRALFLTPR